MGILCQNLKILAWVKPKPGLSVGHTGVAVWRLVEINGQVLTVNAVLDCPSS